MNIIELQNITVFQESNKVFDDFSCSSYEKSLSLSINENRFNPNDVSLEKTVPTLVQRPSANTNPFMLTCGIRNSKSLSIRWSIPFSHLVDAF